MTKVGDDFFIEGDNSVQMFLTGRTASYGPWEPTTFKDFFREYESEEREYQYTLEFTNFYKWVNDKPRMAEQIMRRRINVVDHVRRSETLPVKLELTDVDGYNRSLVFTYGVTFKEAVGEVDALNITDNDGQLISRTNMTPVTLPLNEDYYVHGSVCLGAPSE